MPFANVMAVSRKVNAFTEEKTLLTLAVLSLFSYFWDISLTVLSLVFIQICKKRQTKYIIGAISVAYFITTVVRTAEYIPYISFVLVYLIADFLLEKESHKAVYPAAITFIIAKGYLLTFGYESFYWAVFAVECAMLLVLPYNVSEGFEMLKDNRPVTEFAQLFEIISAFMVTALALDGIHINGLQLSASFLLGAALFYGIKGNISLSLAAALGMVLSLCQQNNFSFLFAGFGVIYLAGVLLLSKGWRGYFILFGVSSVVSLMFISHFNSFIFMTVTGTAMAGCFAAEKLNRTDKAERNSDMTAGESEYADLLVKLEKLNRCFRFLGHTVIDISNLMAKDFVPAQPEDMAAQEICRKCRNNSLCWQENFFHTQQQFSQYAAGLSRGKNAEFDSLFLSRCDRTKQLITALEGAVNLASTQRLMNSVAKHNQKMLQKQFISMAEILRQITFKSSRSGVVNTYITAAMDTFIRNMGKKTEHCLCYQNRDKCIISTKEDFSPQEIYRIKNKLENLYGTKFNLPLSEQEEENIVYTFCQTAAFRCEYSIKSYSRQKNCGDCCEYMETEDNAYIIIADGMGTGSFAAAESRTAVAMLKSLLAAAVEPQTAVEIINIALNLKGTGQSCVAVDILKVDIHTGQTEICKAGGVESIVVSGDKGKIIYKDSLPVGILKDTKTAVAECCLNSGDTVIMTSDGVNIDEKLMDKIALINQTGDAQTVAQYVLNHHVSGDDATAAVLKVIRA